MDATYIVTFKGFPEKFEAVLERMLRDDIAAYPRRMRMESANVDTPKAGSPKKGKGKKVSKNAKS